MNLREETAKVAYELYEKGGRLGGRELEYWLEAEKIVRGRYASEEKKNDEADANCVASEKRKHKRFALRGTESRFPHSTNARIIDVSVGGVAIEATKKLEINKGYNLTIHYKGNPIGLKCRVVWSVLSHEEKKESGDIIRVYKGGLKFDRPLLINTFGNQRSSLLNQAS